MKQRFMQGYAAVFLMCLFGVRAQGVFGQASPAVTAHEPVTVEARLFKTQQGSPIRVELTLTMKKEIHVFSAESLYFEIKTVKSQGLDSPSVTLPKPHPFKNPDNTMSDVYAGTTKIVLTYPVLSKPWSMRGYIQFQACDTAKCYFPSKKLFAFSSTADDSAAQVLAEYTGDDDASGAVTRNGWKEVAGGFRIEGKTGGYQNATKFLGFLENPSAVQSGAETFAGKNIWLVIILVLLGGVALNLTPCVLPMMPITVAILGAGARAGSRLRGFLLGSTYGLAMAISYGILGLIAVLSGTQFGTINSLPAFNFAIAVIFIILAIGMFDIIHIDFTRFRSGIRYKEKSKGKFAAAFFMGIIAALLAGACVAPAVISTILYAATLYSGGAKAGLLLPLLLGLGMALPWPFAGAGLSFLPKPGKWMAAVRNLFGVIILAMALYYGYSGVAIMLESRAPQVTGGNIEKNGDLAWTGSLEQGLQRAAAEHKPVLVDFWATWCKNCTAMDAMTFRNHQVRQKLGEFVLVKYQAENPRDPATREILEYFGVVGLPTYVVMRKAE